MFVKILLSNIYFYAYDTPSSYINRRYLWKYFYCRVARYSLSIEQRSLDNQFVSSKNDTDFDWYSKCEGENDGLKVIFHLKDEKGLIFNLSLTTIDLNAKLEYDNGYTTPFIPLSPLK